MQLFFLFSRIKLKNTFSSPRKKNAIKKKIDKKKFKIYKFWLILIIFDFFSIFLLYIIF